MSNADDNQGRRGLFRRNRSEQPVASNPPPDVDATGSESGRDEAAETERRTPRRTGLGRRKAATDGSWSSDAWEDGWGDDWSDRSSRAGVRPAADPRPAEVDAWLASSDDQLGDITRDIARKWTGNKQTAPNNAAITWADEAPTPSTNDQAFIEDPFTADPASDDPIDNPIDDPFAYPSADTRFDRPSAPQTEALDDLWDASEDNNDWSPAPSDAITFDEELSVEDSLIETALSPSSAKQIGSTWDDSDSDPETLSDSESTADYELPGSTPALKAAGAVFPVDEVWPTNSEIPSDVAVGSGHEEAQSQVEVHDLVEELPQESVVLEASTPEDVTPEPDLHESDLHEPDLREPVTRQPDAHEINELAFDFTGSDPVSTSGEIGEEPNLERQLLEATPLSTTAEILTDPDVEEPQTEELSLVDDALGQQSDTVEAEVLVSELPAAQTGPVERDEFLDSLYEELDEEDVPEQRRIVQHAVTAPQVAVAAQPEVLAAPKDLAAPVSDDRALETPSSNDAIEPSPEQIVLHSDRVAGSNSPEAKTSEPTSSPERTVLFADRQAGSNAPASTPSAARSGVSEFEPSGVIPQDPNADFDFGPDRPVYFPQTNLPPEPTALQTGGQTGTGGPASTRLDPSLTPKQPSNAHVEEDEDLFPPTTADRFSAALDQLDDDRTDPAGLQDPVSARKGFFRGRKQKGSNTPAPIGATVPETSKVASEPITPTAATAPFSATLTEPVSRTVETVAVDSFKPKSRDSQEFDDDEFADYEGFDDTYPEESYFSPKLTKLLSRAGFFLVALAALRMIVLVALAVKDGAEDARGTQDVFHRIGSAFADLGIAHGLMLLVGIAMAAAPALLGDPFHDDESRSIGSSFGVGLIAAVFGVFGGFAAARLAMRINDIAALSDSGVSSTTEWAKLAMNLIATAGVSLVAVIAAIRALGGENDNDR